MEQSTMYRNAKQSQIPHFHSEKGVSENKQTQNTAEASSFVLFPSRLVGIPYFCLFPFAFLLCVKTNPKLSEANSHTFATENKAILVFKNNFRTFFVPVYRKNLRFP
jgi:hypothetical protein